MLRCRCPSVCPSVCLSVTEVHWRVIANLGFKFRSHFTAHCGHRAARRAACGRIISRHASQCQVLLFLLGVIHAGRLQPGRGLGDQWRLWLCLSVCPRFKRKKTWAISAKLGGMNCVHFVFCLLCSVWCIFVLPFGVINDNKITRSTGIWKTRVQIPLKPVTA